jgi:hypothetical protein
MCTQSINLKYAKGAYSQSSNVKGPDRGLKHACSNCKDYKALPVVGLPNQPILPRLGWRVPSAASRQAPSSRAALAPKNPTEEGMVGQSAFCEGELLPNSANRYDVAEPQLLVLTFFSILTVNMLWLWLMPADPLRHESALRNALSGKAAVKTRISRRVTNFETAQPIGVNS